MTSAERAAYALGRQSFERGERETALEAFRALLETRSGFADVHYMKAVLHDAGGELEEAAQELREAIRINPSYAEALLALATLYERTGDYDRARGYAERAAQVARGSGGGGLDATTRGKLANLQASVGDACAEAGELREAIDAYRKALDRCPDFHDIRYRLGIALREAGLAHQALLEFQRVLRGNPGYLEATIQLGLTYYTLGRPQEAIEQWAWALGCDPSLEEARMYMRLVRYGRRGAPTAGSASERGGTDDAHEAPPPSRPAPAAGDG